MRATIARTITVIVDFGIGAPQRREHELRSMRASGEPGGDRGVDVVAAIVMMNAVMIVLVIAMAMW